MVTVTSGLPIQGNIWVKNPYIKNAFSNVLPQKLSAISSLAPSCVMAEAPSKKFLPVMGCRCGSSPTWHTSDKMGSKVIVSDRWVATLWARACSTRKLVPQACVVGTPVGCQWEPGPLLKVPLCMVKPTSFTGNTVSQLQADIRAFRQYTDLSRPH